MTQWPNTGKVKEMLKKIPFVVVIDSMMTSTALYADLVAAVRAVAPDIIATTSNPRLIEFNAPGAHKGAALARLAAHLGFGMEAVMAFGDGLNDLTMVRDSGWGVAMANAVPEVLAAARFTTLSNDDDGVAAAIERLVLKRNG